MSQDAVRWNAVKRRAAEVNAMSQTKPKSVAGKSVPRVASDLQRVFPLPLTAFEEYMVADDRRDYPMTFSIELTLTGELHSEQFLDAHKLATHRNPLLASHLVRKRHGNHWEWAPGESRVEFSDEATPVDYAMSDRRINLREEPAVRTRLHATGEKIRIAFVFHHAATDGVGAMNFIGDLLAAYGQLTTELGEECPTLPEVSVQHLTRRGHLWNSQSVPHRSWRRTLGHLLEFATRMPTGIARSPAAETEQLQRPFVTRIVDRQRLRDIKQVARRWEVQPNDIYLACLFLTLEHWNATVRQSDADPWYRILIPTSLRTFEHDAMPAANVLSFVLVNNRNARRSIPTVLVKSLHGRVTRILETADSRLFVRVLSAVRSVPGGLRLLTQSSVRTCTAVLANVGDVRRQLRCHFPLKKGKCVAGSVTLDGLFGAAPIRPGTAVGISLGTYAGELLINFNCDPHSFPGAIAEQFADSFLEHLGQLHKDLL